MYNFGFYNLISLKKFVVTYPGFGMSLLRISKGRFVFVRVYYLTATFFQTSILSRDEVASNIDQHSKCFNCGSFFTSYSTHVQKHCKV